MRPAKMPSQVEFVAGIAMLFAIIAFSIDALLPGLPAIAAELTPDAPDRAQLIVGTFVLGMGLGTLAAGPISDAVGRKPVVLAGAALYCAGAALGWAAQSLEALLLGRLVQGLGASGPRVVCLAIVRDLYAGRPMARIMSFVLTVFTLVPAIAPLLGSLIIAASGWRAVFAAFLAFSLASTLWLLLRQPETHPPERRRPLALRSLGAAMAEVMGNRAVVLAMSAQALAFSMLLSTIATIQPIFEQTFGRAESFPYWFGGIALISATGSIVNATLVERLGMRRIAMAVIGAQVIIAGTVALAFAGGVQGVAAFALYLVWAQSLFFVAAFTIGNLNALAMEPMGHIAGLAASVIGCVATVGAVLIAVPIGLSFDGTPQPIAVGVACAAAVAFALLAWLRETAPA